MIGRGETALIETTSLLVSQASADDVCQARAAELEGYETQNGTGAMVTQHDLPRTTSV